MEDPVDEPRRDKLPFAEVVAIPPETWRVAAVPTFALSFRIVRTGLAAEFFTISPVPVVFPVLIAIRPPVTMPAPALILTDPPVPDTPPPDPALIFTDPPAAVLPPCPELMFMSVPMEDDVEPLAPWM